MGLAYYLRQKGLSRVGILAPNTPAFLVAVYGIGGAGGVNVGESNRHLLTRDKVFSDEWMQQSTTVLKPTT